MKTFRINFENISFVAKFMTEIEHLGEDFINAMLRLSGGVGWHIGEDSHEPLGWILCKPVEKYRTLEVECMGMKTNDGLVINEELQPLLNCAEDWAKMKGFSSMSVVLDTKDTSCAHKRLGEIGEELKNLVVNGKEDYEWLSAVGFKKSGLLPNAFGEGKHGLVLVKEIIA